MIFVTVGMHSQGFDRLIKKMDEIAGKINEEVIMQVGSTAYKPKNAKYFVFKNFQKMQELVRETRVVVCHGGAGTIIAALDYEIPVIAVPRLKKYNEAIDDHQLELINALEKDGKITAVYDIEKLENTLTSPFVNSHTNMKKDDRLVRTLGEYINKLTK